MKRVAICALAAIVGGCLPIPGPPPPYHALGTKPPWNLLIGEHEMTFAEMGQQPVSQPTPKVIVGIAGEIYRTERISVNIVHSRCSDGTSDRAYPDTVQITVDERHFNGCGGL